jgi:hypothetical protein
MMAFRVGQTVVCVDAEPRDGAVLGLTKGLVYTISDFGGCKNGSWGVFLAECDHDRGWAFYPDRFRPVVERKTDISALRALLVPGTKIREIA